MSGIILRDRDLSSSDPFWGGHGYVIDDAVVQYCRAAFNGKYNNYWIYPIYVDNTYLDHTLKFFKEVGIELLPKLSKLPPAPKKPVIKCPHRNKRSCPCLRPDGHCNHEPCSETDKIIAYNSAMQDYRREVWEIVWGDYHTNISKGVSPITVVVQGVRFLTKSEQKKVDAQRHERGAKYKPAYSEKITSVQRVKDFSERVQKKLNKEVWR